MALLLVGGAVIWRKRWRRRAYHQGLIARLRARYPPVHAELPHGAYRLLSPPGRVSIGDEGLLLQIEAERATRCHVPWGDVHHVEPADGGILRVHIAGVGDVTLPTAAGRQIWEGILAAPTESDPGERLPAAG